MPELNEMFDFIYSQIDSSEVYKKYCQFVHGEALYQINMTDMVMIKKLFDLLQIGEDDKVFELGCGLGGVSEYIFDKTGASVLGIDFSRKAIDLALTRSKRKNGLRFLCHDIENVCELQEKFNVILAIDSLMFLKDINGFISKLSNVILPNGRVGTLYTQPLMFNGGESSLEPEDTLLGRALRNNNIQFDYWDFTEQEQKVWERKIQYSQELRDEFVNENNLALCENSAKEAENMLQLIRDGLCRKYLYYFELTTKPSIT